MMVAPSWIDAIEGPLHDVVTAVWFRLPHPAKAMLTERRIEARVVDDDKFRELAGTNRYVGHISLVRQNGSYFHMLLLNKALERWPQDAARGVVAHELAHAVLWHLDFGVIQEGVPFPEKVSHNLAILMNLQADYMICELWGFRADKLAWRNWMTILARANPEAFEKVSAPAWAL